MKYPSELIVVTERTPDGSLAWGIRDGNGKSYDIADAKSLWFEAMEAGEDIDCNLTFARLVERNFDAQTFDEYLNDR